jgi:ribosome recycling factor
MEDLIVSAQQNFQKIISVVVADLGTIRTGKANPALIENVLVEAYGERMKLIDLAAISVSDPKTLLVTPFDAGNSQAITKAIGDANLGLTAVEEDTYIRVMVPPLSQDRREEFVKMAKTKIEGGKVMVRQERHVVMEKISKADVDDDTKARLEKETQNLTDKTVAELDHLLSKKEEELLAI